MQYFDLMTLNQIIDKIYLANRIVKRNGCFIYPTALIATRYNILT